MHLPDPHKALPGDFSGRDFDDSFVVPLAPRARDALARVFDALDDDVDADIDAAVALALADAHAAVRAALARGPGFIVVRGVPVEGRAPAGLRRFALAMAQALGTPVPQNLEGELVTDIKDAGKDPRDPDVRLYQTRAEQDFHTDGADVIGLLCLRPARSGGQSALVSSVRVFRAVCAARPDLAPLLFEPWWFHLPGGPARGLPPAFARPIATFDGHKLETFFIGWYLKNAVALGAAPPLTDAQRALLALYEATANDPRLGLTMDLRPGDVQWLRNAFVLHKRTAYVDDDDPKKHRHLLRLWLDADAFRDDTPRFEATTPSTRPTDDDRGPR